MTYELNHIYNMDCMVAMKDIPDKYFELAIVDPEYGRKQHGGINRSGYVKQANGTKLYVADGGYAKKDWDSKPADAQYFDELFRVSKNQIIWGVNYFGYKFGPGRIVWDKCNDGSDQSDCEIAYCSLIDTVRIFRYMWRGMFQGKGIDNGWIQQGNKLLNEKRIHPTQKPVALYKWQLREFAHYGWKIIDTNSGSCSLEIACHDMGFEYMAFEIDKDYYDAAMKRIEAHKAQLRMDI
jgi:site-specific DNA-methyltransferase (adenine-specific)